MCRLNEICQLRAVNKVFLFVLFVGFIPVLAKGQSKVTLSGYVTDAKNGETLINASISIKELNGKGAITNAYGFYSLTIEPGTYHFTCQYIGYSAKLEVVDLRSSKSLNFVLSEQSGELQEIVVTGEKEDKNLEQTQTGMQKLDVKSISSIPVLLGEKDVLKTIQLLPGIKSTGEGSSGFNVRGGASDQNLILLDEATVYNASHLMGFFSVFNSDAIKDLSVYKGNEPAEYGGRLASVLEIKMKEGNNQDFSASGGLGLISSRLTLEGPLAKGKSSFIVSARRTYLDLFLKMSSDDDLNSTRLYFYDVNAKVNLAVNDKNRLYLSGYFGKDVMGMDDFGLNWGNSTGTFRWNHLFTDRIFSNTSLIFSNYNYKIEADMGDEINIISRIQDYGFKEDLEYFFGNNSNIKFGFSSTYHRMIPGVITTSGDVDLKDLSNKHSLESAAYISAKTTISQKLDAVYGIRVSSFSFLGPGDFYTYDSEGNAIDTATYSSGDVVKTYTNFEPRVTLNYKLNQVSSVKAAYARNVQNLHLLSNSASGNPTDLWIPSSNNVKPEIADQVSLGYYRNFKDNMYEFSTEIYYKDMQNQIDYKNGAELNYNENVESQILFGIGRAYGIEFYLKKNAGRFNGWLSYTLSRTERKFDEINDGAYFPARQDKTHDLSLVANYTLNSKWTLSGTWVCSTGNAVTFPTGKYEIDGKTMMLYSERNADRMPMYHRLDIGITRKNKTRKNFETSWNFSIYNFYSRENAYTITFRDSEDDDETTEAVLTSLFKFIPSITYNFKF